MKVLKFGGSSVASAQIVGKLVQIVSSASQQERLIVVSSAISKCTDTLIKIGAEASEGNGSYTSLVYSLRCIHRRLIGELLKGSAADAATAECDAEFDRLEAFADGIFAARELSDADAQKIQTFGELFSTRILARTFAKAGLKAMWIDSREVVRVRGGKVDYELTYSNIRAFVEAHPEVDVFVAQGFIASDEDGRPVTLGRGGSDYSAAIYAAGSGSRIVEIWTDVPGIMTSDPRLIPAAVTIPYLSYGSARDMARFGAKVLYPPTVEPARLAHIPICILNTYDPDAQGSLIMDNPPHRAEGPLGLTSLDYPQFRRELPSAKLLPEGGCIPGADGGTVIALVCNNLPPHATERLCAALGKAGIKALGTAVEGGNVFALVRSAEKRDAMLAVHRAFFEARPLRVINLFIAGYGAVGKALVGMIRNNGEKIARRSGRKLRIVGVSNSRNYVINTRGIQPSDVDTLLPYGPQAGGGAFFDALGSIAMRDAVLVDCTNSESIGARYEEFFRRGLNVVSCNRRAFTVPFARYNAMKAASCDYGLALKYDTTVGTSLPVLESISNSSFSGDEIVGIEAVVSCTLNNIITNYDGANTDSIAVLLRRAQDIGLTEKDPRADLGGRDALRKLLILAREAGFALEESDVVITPMLGPEFFDCPIDEFYRRLAEWEPKFIAREAELDEMGMRQRFVASIRKDTSLPSGFAAEIKMQLVGPDSPFFWISGTENVVVIRSAMSAPIVIKGPGEGANMAASGVINNILAL